MPTHLRTLGIVCFTTLLAASSSWAGPNIDGIGINFTATRFGGGPYPILPNESAGLVPQMNWNNTADVGNGSTGDIVSPVPDVLVDSHGVDSGANIAWYNGNETVNSEGGNATPNERLYRGVLEADNFPYGEPLSVAVFDVPYETYDVYAYLARFAFESTASVRLGDEEYFFDQSDNFTEDGFIQATATRVEDSTLATYAVFRNQTAKQFTLELITQTGNRASIAGLQIVSVPEAGTLPLVGACTVGIAAFLYRRRNKSAFGF